MEPTDAEVTFLAKEGLYSQLCEEAKFTIEAALKREGIKVHSVSTRVKELGSFLYKIERKSYGDPFAQMPDLAGMRIVCLFLSDLPRIEHILNAEFEIMNSENKVDPDNYSSFGYMSQHYECKLGQRYSGPRYDDVRDITFEVQSRTIVMDAWANISHHLAYKGEASVPRSLRRDFHALSGLFYVADQHFELFVKESTEVGKELETKVRTEEKSRMPLDLDTVAAILEAKFPEREHTVRTRVSYFVEEVVEAGYFTVEELETAIDRGLSQALEDEVEEPPRPGPRYTSLGIARMALKVADGNYREINQRNAKRRASQRKSKKPRSN